MEETGWGPAWVRLSWTSWRGANHKSEALKKCYKEGVSFPVGSASRFSTVGHKQTVLEAVSHSPLPPACCPPPSLVTGLTYGEGWKAAALTVQVIVCSLWKEDVWPGLETALWLLRPVLRPQGALGTLGVHRSLCLQTVASWATVPVFECCFRSWTVRSPRKQICM